MPVRHLMRLLVLSLMIALGGCGRCGADAPSPEGSAPEPEAPDETAAEEEAIRSDALASVNGRPVMTASELEEHIQFLVDRYESLPDRPPTTALWRNHRRRMAVQSAVHDHLIQLEIERQGIEVSDEDIAESLRQELGTLYEDDRLFQQYLDARELERQAFLAQREREIAERRLLESRGDLEPDPEAVEAYYRNNIARWEEGERVLVSNLALRFRRDADPELVARTGERMATIRQRIVDGEDFADVAQEMGQTSDRRRGGDLGWVVRGRRSQLIQDGVEEVLFTAPTGTITEPIRTSIGFQIFWIRDRRPAGIRPFDEVESVILEPLRRQQRLRLRTELIRELEESAEVLWFEDRWGLESEEGPSDLVEAPTAPAPAQTDDEAVAP